MSGSGRKLTEQQIRWSDEFRLQTFTLETSGGENKNIHTMRETTQTHTWGVKPHKHTRGEWNHTNTKETEASPREENLTWDNLQGFQSSFSWESSERTSCFEAEVRKQNTETLIHVLLISNLIIRMINVSFLLQVIKKVRFYKVMKLIEMDWYLLFYFISLIPSYFLYSSTNTRAM